MATENGLFRNPCFSPNTTLQHLPFTLNLPISPPLSILSNDLSLITQVDSPSINQANTNSELIPIIILVYIHTNRLNPVMPLSIWFKAGLGAVTSFCNIVIALPIWNTCLPVFKGLTSLTLRVLTRWRVEKCICRLGIRVQIVRVILSIRLSIRSKTNIYPLSFLLSRRSLRKRSMLSNRSLRPSGKKSKIKGISRSRLIVS